MKPEIKEIPARLFRWLIRTMTKTPHNYLILKIIVVMIFYGITLIEFQFLQLFLMLFG